jgi:hypothetical protein
MANSFSKIGTMSMTSHRSITFINIKEKVISQEAKYFREQIERDNPTKDLAGVSVKHLCNRPKNEHFCKQASIGAYRSSTA